MKRYEPRVVGVQCATDDHIPTGRTAVSFDMAQILVTEFVVSHHEVLTIDSVCAFRTRKSRYAHTGQHRGKYVPPFRLRFPRKTLPSINVLQPSLEDKESMSAVV